MSLPHLSAARATAAVATVGTLLVTACGGPNTDTSDAGITGEERIVEFASAGATHHGTLTLPESAAGAAEEPMPGVLIISGSGPTDRDGNSPLRPNAGTNRNFARVLSDAGVASLRYDKLGSGETGLPQGDDGEQGTIDYDDYENGVVAAYSELAEQPEVDPERLLVLGHSEGALFALRAPQVVQDPPPEALLLAAPPGERYLDTIDRQVTEQVRRAESAGDFDSQQATQVVSDTRYGISRLRADEPLPDDMHAALDGLFEPQVEPFLRRIDETDPVELANDLPADTETLVLWGTADAQIAENDVDRVMTGLDDGTRVDIEDADHVFRQYDDAPGAAALDSDRPFSEEVAPAIRDFVATVV